MGQLASSYPHQHESPDNLPFRDGYDNPEAQLQESKSRNGIFNVDRGNRRYDPHSRKYVLWEHDNNYDKNPLKNYPIFTRKEREWLARHPRRRLKSKEWNVTGPKASIKWPL